MDWLIVGLGNPGKEYAATRHNAGAMAITAIRKAHGEDFDNPTKKFQALISKGRLDGRQVMLLFPETYMNNSGQAVAEAASFYKVAPKNVLVISDDKDLPLGTLRLRLSGSAGGHNGLKSIIAHLGTPDFPRLKIGIGTALSEDRRVDTADFVLARPSKEELTELQVAVARAAEAVTTIVESGPEAAMGRYN